MTGMPQLIAQLHSFVGRQRRADRFQCLHRDRRRAARRGHPQTDLAFHLAEVWIRCLHPRCSHLHRLNRGLKGKPAEDHVEPPRPAGHQPC